MDGSGGRLSRWVVDATAGGSPSVQTGEPEICSNTDLYIRDPQRRVWFAVHIFSQQVWVVTNDKGVYLFFPPTQAIVVNIQSSKYKGNWLGVRLTFLLLVP